ncbi:MAG: glycosyltransferase family 4 protein [Legionellales bacterium]
MKAKRLLFIINNRSFFISHRLPLAIAARNKGFEVHIATPQGGVDLDIDEPGFIYHAYALSRKGTNPIAELGSMYAVYKLIQKLRPDILHLVTIKPIIYGGLMARLLKVPAVVAAVSGLGTLFTAQSYGARILQRGIVQLYGYALRHPNVKVIFQNEDDRQLLLKSKAFSKGQTTLIRGSGVDLHSYKDLPEKTGVVVVAMISRLLSNKGVLEYVAAAKSLKASGVEARFLLIGEPDFDNPAYIDEAQLEQWRKEGDVELLGFRKDIDAILQDTHLVVLASYREGLPKILAEAAACGRAVITTDVPGCRDAIIPNKTGLLIPVKDAKALAEAMKRLIENPLERLEFGKAGRALAEREFGIEHIIAAHLKVYGELGFVS